MNFFEFTLIHKNTYDVNKMFEIVSEEHARVDAQRTSKNESEYYSLVFFFI